MLANEAASIILNQNKKGFVPVTTKKALPAQTNIANR
jgi:hypothetical protein